MSLYLLINLLSVAVPLLSSFHPRLQVYRTWPALWPAIVLTAAVFIAWDVLFTRWGVWGFNPRYLSGAELLHLPLEEWLFFVCIPYACVFTYACLKRLLANDYLGSAARSITIVLAIILLLIGAFNLSRLYTATAFLATGVFLLLHVTLFKSRYLGRFYVAFLAIQLPFLLVNGVLTGSFIAEEVVWYNNAENLGVRVFTIPVEDFVYALALILMNVTIYEKFLAGQRVPTQR